MASSIRKGIKLNKENVDWFKTKYPGASLSWILDLLLTKFREVNDLGPGDYAELGALEIKRMLEDT
jgi:hypothetical protein